MKINLSERYLPQVAIVAHGSLSDTKMVSQLIEDAPHLIICDGALARFREISSRIPDIVIGDGDSVSSADLVAMGLKLTRVADQETNDLTKAVRYALSKGWREIGILGATGKREDHTLGNIALLAEYFQMGAEVRMISEYGVMLPFEGLLQMEVTKGQQLSFFALSNAPMSARGVAYPFENRSFGTLWEATLNYASNEVVEVETGGPALVYIAKEVRK